MAKIKSPPIKIIAQLLQLRRMFPDSVGSIRRDELRWRGNLQPTQISATYTIDLSFRIKQFPKVHVFNAPWRNGSAKRPPHTYLDGSLCLYYPRANEFDSTMFLAQTIIPWTAEWLLHYELWLASADHEWFGGGIVHSPPNLDKERPKIGI
jgi:hypothetical protein